MRRTRQDRTYQSVEHTDGWIFVLAVRTLDDVITERVLVDADDHVSVLCRHTRKQLATVARPRTFCRIHRIVTDSSIITTWHMVTALSCCT